jgi:hypothetical protein
MCVCVWGGGERMFLSITEIYNKILLVTSRYLKLSNLPESLINLFAVSGIYVNFY